jgi:hypothetical protein
MVNINTENCVQKELLEQKHHIPVLVQPDNETPDFEESERFDSCLREGFMAVWPVIFGLICKG